jgi:hypothetical protein
MTEKEHFELVRTLISQAIAAQRLGWDLALAAEDVASCPERDVYALVSELAGGLDDGELVPDDTRLSLQALTLPKYPDACPFAAYKVRGTLGLALQSWVFCVTALPKRSHPKACVAASGN